MGGWIARIRRGAPQHAAARQFVYGALAVLGTVSCLHVASSWLARRLNDWKFGWLAEASILYLLIAWKGLMQAGEAVSKPLERGDLVAARHELSWRLVSRDVSQLSESLIAAATIESLAENMSDSVVAPLLWYGAGGLPCALIYRFLNTADAMLGYRDEEREWLGKTAARLDDLVNLIPARLTALLIVASAPVSGGKLCQAWQIWRRDARRTASPHAGHPMSAAAGALGVVLEKVGHYRLGAGLARPTVVSPSPMAL